MSAVLPDFPVVAALPESAHPANGRPVWVVHYFGACGAPIGTVLLPLVVKQPGLFCLRGSDRQPRCAPNPDELGDIYRRLEPPPQTNPFDMPAEWPAGDPTHALLLMVHFGADCVDSLGFKEKLAPPVRAANAKKAIAMFLRHPIVKGTHGRGLFERP